MQQDTWIIILITTIEEDIEDMATIIRRRKLGRTSVREICRYSKTSIKGIRNDYDLPPDDLYIRWGCTSPVPARNIINTSRAIHEVNDKLGFRRKLNAAGLSPKTYFTGDIPEEYPVLLRKPHHAQGRGIFVAHDRAQYLRLHFQLGEYYASEIINKISEYRVFVAQGRAVWVAKKTPGNPEDLAWNVARGGRFDNVRFSEWPLKVVRVAIEAFNLSQLDFGGVDVMLDAEGNAYVLEINSAPSQTSPYRQECTAKALDYMVLHGKERLPLIPERGSWKKFIHPCISNKAQLVGE